MIAQLSGLVAHKDGMDVVIDCQGVGYAVSVSLSGKVQVWRLLNGNWSIY